MNVKRLLGLLIFAATLASAGDRPTIRICVAPLENHSKYTFAVDKVKQYFLSELDHKQIKAVDIPDGADVLAEMKSQKCEYLVRSKFTDYVTQVPGQVISIAGIVIDEKKKFVLKFDFELRKADEKLVLGGGAAYIDKNPKTCGDDAVYEAAKSIRDHFKGRK